MVKYLFVPFLLGALRACMLLACMPREPTFYMYTWGPHYMPKSHCSLHAFWACILMNLAKSILSRYWSLQKSLCLGYNTYLTTMRARMVLALNRGSKVRQSSSNLLIPHPAKSHLKGGSHPANSLFPPLGYFFTPHPALLLGGHPAGSISPHPVFLLGLQMPGLYRIIKAAPL